MRRERIESIHAPAAIGPYSQAIRCGDLLFLSGQIPLDPETGDMAGQDVGVQARQVLTNLGSVLAGAGLGWNNVVKTTIYLCSLADFGAVNEVYAEFVAEPFPARATVEVSALPHGARIEIEAIAVAPAAGSCGDAE